MQFGVLLKISSEQICVEEGLDAELMSRAEEPAAVNVPDRKGEIADQVLHTGIAPGVIGELIFGSYNDGLATNCGTHCHFPSSAGCRLTPAGHAPGKIGLHGQREEL